MRTAYEDTIDIQTQEVTEERTGPHFLRIVRRYWSEEQDQLLKRLHTEGESNTEIARRLGRTERAIHTRKWVIGIACGRHPQVWGKDEKTRLWQMREAGVSFEAIADALQRSVKSVESKHTQVRLAHLNRGTRGRPTDVDYRMAERNARPEYSVGYAPTLSQTLFGDPPPGRSALDQRRAGGRS